MSFIAENWDNILTVINLIGLMIVGRYKGKK